MSHAPHGDRQRRPSCDRVDGYVPEGRVLDLEEGREGEEDEDVIVARSESSESAQSVLSGEEEDGMLSLHRALRSAARLRGHVPGKSIALFLITHYVTIKRSRGPLSTERHLKYKIPTGFS